MSQPLKESTHSWALVVAGGGTGGHLFPAIAVHEALTALAGRDIPTLWLCSNRSIDEQILGSRHLHFEPLRAQPFSLRPRGFLKFHAGWGLSVRTSRAALQKLKRTHSKVIVLSTGGFAAAPVVQAARIEVCPVHALVLDDPPGKATRWILRHSQHVYDATLAGRVPNAQHVGPIIRSGALTPTHTDRAACAQHWGLDPVRPVLLVTGGSLGARSLNEFVMAFITEHGAEIRSLGWQVLHQAGGQAGGQGEDDQHDHLAAAYDQAGIDAKVVETLDPMGLAWGAAEFAICRAGAGTVAEVALNAVPTAFMPYPFHKDQHQAHNTRPLVEARAARLWDDHVDPAANLGVHGPELLELLTSQDLRDEMRVQLEPLSSSLPREAASVVGRSILDSVGWAPGSSAGED